MKRVYSLLFQHFSFFLLFSMSLFFFFSLSSSSTRFSAFSTGGVCNLLKMSRSLSRLAPVGNDCVSAFWSHRVSSFLALCLHGYFSSFPPRSNSAHSYQSSFHFFIFLVTFCFSDDYSLLLVGWRALAAIAAYNARQTEPGSGTPSRPPLSLSSSSSTLSSPDFSFLFYFIFLLFFLV